MAATQVRPCATRRTRAACGISGVQEGGRVTPTGARGDALVQHGLHPNRVSTRLISARAQGCRLLHRLHASDQCHAIVALKPD